MRMSVCDSRPAVKPAFPAVGYVCVCVRVCGHDVLFPCACVCLHPTVDGRGSER